MLAPGRASCWRHKSGRDATLDAFQKVWTTHLSLVIALGPDLYESIDFKAGVEVDKISAAKALLLDFLELDSRGGIVAQTEVAIGLTRALDADPTSRAQMYSHATSDMDHASEVVGFTAYKVRVMLRHLRNIFDDGFTHTRPLIPLLSRVTSS